MAKSTGIIVATGGITMFNQSVLHEKSLDWRIPVATGFAAMIFSLFEKANQPLVVGAAWITLLTVLLTRMDPKVPSPAETMLKYWNSGGKS